MNGTIGHLRNVADLVAALDLCVILGEAGLHGDHPERQMIDGSLMAATAALYRLADLVEEVAR